MKSTQLALFGLLLVASATEIHAMHHEILLGCPTPKLEPGTDIVSGNTRGPREVPMSGKLKNPNDKPENFYTNEVPFAFIQAGGYLECEYHYYTQGEKKFLTLRSTHPEPGCLEWGGHGFQCSRGG